MLAERLLAPVRDAEVDALLLGCTHYPFLARVDRRRDGPRRRAGQLGRRDRVRGARACSSELGLLRDRDGAAGRHRFLSSRRRRHGSAELGRRLLGPELDHAGRAGTSTRPSTRRPARMPP